MHRKRQKPREALANPALDSRASELQVGRGQERNRGDLVFASHGPVVYNVQMFRTTMVRLGLSRHCAWSCSQCRIVYVAVALLACFLFYYYYFFFICGAGEGRVAKVVMPHHMRLCGSYWRPMSQPTAHWGSNRESRCYAPTFCCTSCRRPTHISKLASRLELQ